MSKFTDGLRKVLGAVGATGIEMALPGPLGKIATGFLAKALGKAGATEEEIAAAVSTATPEDIVKIKEAEQEFQKFLAENDIKLLELDNEDRANARAREIAVRDHMPAVVALIVMAAFAVALLWIMKWGIADTAKDVVMIMIGVLGAKFGSVVDYFVGSSAGSRNKSDTIDAIVAKT
jgi:hypothetical protein